MAFRVKFTGNARQEAREILARLREQSAGEAGLRWFEGLKSAIASLREFPARCAIAPESEIPWKCGNPSMAASRINIASLFNVEADGVWILHIRHGRRDRLTHRGDASHTQISPSPIVLLPFQVEVGTGKERIQWEFPQGVGSLGKSPEGRRLIGVSKLTSLLPMRCTWGAWAAGSRGCWIAGCSTLSMVMSGRYTWRVQRP